MSNKAKELAVVGKVSIYEWNFSESEMLTIQLFYPSLHKPPSISEKRNHFLRKSFC